MNVGRVKHDLMGVCVRTENLHAAELEIVVGALEVIAELHLLLPSGYCG